MASAVTPAAIEGFLAGLRAGQSMRAQRDAGERADLALGVQMDEAARRQQSADLARRVGEANLAAGLDRMQRQAAGRAVVPKLLGATPETVEVAPAVPVQAAVPPQPTMTLQPGEDPEAGAFIGATPAVPGRPGRPATTVSAHTLPSLAKAAGGEADLAAALETPEGQRAMQTLKPVSAQEFEGMQRKSKAREEFTRVNDEAREALEAGDAMKAAGLRVRAMRAALEGGADSVAAARALQDAEKWYFDLRREPEERKKADAELAPFMAALRAYRERPDHDTETGVVEAAAGVSHKLALPVVKEALGAFEKAATRNAKAGYVHRDVAALNAATTQLYNQAVADGAPFTRETWVAARQQAARTNPAGAAMLFDLPQRDPKAKLSDLDREALLGDIAAPKNVQEEAIRNVRARQKGLAPGSAGFVEAVTQEATRITLARRPPRGEGRDTTNYELRARRSQIVTQGKALVIEEAAVLKRLQDKPRTPEQTQQAQRDQARLGAIRADRTDLSRRIGDLDTALNDRLGVGSAPAVPERPASPGSEPPAPATPAVAAPKPGAAAATLAPEQRTQVQETLRTVVRELYPGKSLLRELSPSERERAMSEVNRRLGR